MRASCASSWNDVHADVIQLDEANISGHPEDREWAAEAINCVLEGIHGERALHVCFGNYAGQTIQKGFWWDLIPFFNQLKVNHLVLEFARRGYDELQAFRDMDRRIGLGLGVMCRSPEKPPCSLFPPARQNVRSPFPGASPRAAASAEIPSLLASRSIRSVNRTVRIDPGLIALTRTPSFTPRSARLFVKFSRAALTEPPIANSAFPVLPPTPAMLIMLP